MTILYPKTFKQMRPYGYSGEFDWDFLSPVWSGTFIKPMDIDYVTERYGSFAIIETKSNRDIELPTGQKITFESLLKLGNGKICLFILPTKDSLLIDEWEEWHWSRRESCIITRKIRGNASDFMQRHIAWRKMAEGRI